MNQRTTIHLDRDQIREAAELLGTQGTGETVRAALAEVIRAKRRARLLEMKTGLTLADLRSIREPRFPELP